MGEHVHPGRSRHSHDDHKHDDHDHDHGDHEHHDHPHSKGDSRSPSQPAKGLQHSHPEHNHDVDTKFSPNEARQAKRLTIVLVVVALFFVVEFLGARAARSEVLQADAIHLLMDVLALGMSLFAMRLAVRRPTARFTFGLRRAEPVAAVFNALLVLIAAYEIVRDAVADLLHQGTAPRENIMLIVAALALVVNGISAWLLHGAMHGGHDHGDHKGHGAHGHHLNLRGVWLHLLGDALGSVAALGAALVIRFGGPSSVDPLASFIVVVILVVGAIRLLRDALVVLLEAAPPHISVQHVRTVARAVEGVIDVHDLHVWTLGAGREAIMVHVTTESKNNSLAPVVERALRDAFDVEYVTVQVEPEDSACAAPPSRFEESESS